VLGCAGPSSYSCGGGGRGFELVSRPACFRGYFLSLWRFCEFHGCWLLQRNQNTMVADSTGKMQQELGHVQERCASPPLPTSSGVTGLWFLSRSAIRGGPCWGEEGGFAPGRCPPSKSWHMHWPFRLPSRTAERQRCSSAHPAADVRSLT